MRRFVSFLLTIILLLSSACAESATTALQELYAQAELLMVQGDYTGAAAKFEALGTYSDASQMTMYCKAIVAAEDLGLYAMAVDAFYDLGDFKDSRQMALYYEGRAYETAGMIDVGKASDSDLSNAILQLEKAELVYGGLAFFKDSLTRLSACGERVKVIKSEQSQRLIAAKEATYKSALAFELNTDYAEAIKLYQSIIDYKDSTERIVICQKAILDEKYDAAVALMNAGEYEEALALFTDIMPERDVSNEICYIAGTYEAAGNKARAAFTYGVVAHIDSDTTRCTALWAEIAHRDIISAGAYCTVGLKADGTVLTVGDDQYGRYDVSGWRDIIAISAGRSMPLSHSHTVGLKKDGTVLAVGANSYGQCDVSGWRDIVAISAGYSHTVGLKADGTVLAVGTNKYGQCDVSEWRDIVAISAGYNYTVGLKADGTVLSVGYKSNQRDVSGWRDIVAISAGYNHIVGLKADGTVLAAGDDLYGQCNVGKWRDIFAISAGEMYTIGLKTDGTVLATGNDQYGKCNVNGWRDIVAISTGVWHTIGLKADGTVLAVGYNDGGACNVSKWRLKQPAKRIED